MFRAIAPGAPTKPVDPKVQALQLREACRMVAAPCGTYGVDQLERSVDARGPVATTALLDRSRRLQDRQAWLVGTQVATGFLTGIGGLTFLIGLAAAMLPVFLVGLAASATGVAVLVGLERVRRSAAAEQAALVSAI